MDTGRRPGAGASPNNTAARARIDGSSALYVHRYVGAVGKALRSYGVRNAATMVRRPLRSTPLTRLACPRCSAALIVAMTTQAVGGRCATVAAISSSDGSAETSTVVVRAYRARI